MRIKIHESFADRHEMALALQYIAMQVERGDDEDTDPSWEIVYPEEQLPVERPEPDMPRRM